MLELTGIYKTFHAGTANEKRALDGVSLKLEDGDFVTVIGGNGSGKTTLLNVVSGALQADDGRIMLDGTELSGMPEHRRARYLGRVFQDPMLGTAPDMQIDENLALAARRGERRGLRWHVGRGEREYYRELLRDFGLGLEDRLNTRVGLLSGGQRQALTLLMATLRRPRLLLLDEHTAALDPRTAEKVLAVTRKAVTENRLTTLMITHNMADAIRCGNRLVMMREGRIIYAVSGQEKRRLTVEELLAKFRQIGRYGLADGQSMRDDGIFD